MKRPTSEKLQLLRAHYTAGSRVRLLQMDDPYRPDLKAGAMGMQQSTGVPKSIVDTITATFICVATMDLLFTFYGSKKKKKSEKSGKEGQEA